jgi:type IV pilus assembly protein PilV
MLNRRHQQSIPPKSGVAARQGGVALLEALIAILIFSLGVLGLIGLQASATKTATQAKFRMEAGHLATQRIADLWLDRTNMAGYDGDVPAPTLPNGIITTSVVGTTVIVTVSWKAPGDAVANSHQAIANVTTNP